MGAGVDPIGQTEETSLRGTISWQVVISNRRVWMLLIVLAGTMIGLAPEKVDALLAVIGG
jgi:hypothetical protein